MKKFIPKILVLLFLSFLLIDCSKDDCTEFKNVPKWDPIKGSFVDNYIEVPCGLGDPVVQPVNANSN
ncbi:MAG: hypothetical protein QM495_11555 [Lutibacter sp.]|uniref:hypothetical protein n=1 Tax=Lutibacter sp. TaxID=1925666 RepID=UPI00385BBCDD